MVEILGVLLALILSGAAWSAWRVADGIAHLVGGWPRVAASPGGAVRARRLHAARATAQVQSAQLAAMSTELLRTRAMLRLAQRERDLLRAREGGIDDRFPRAKRAFALRFHPDRVAGRGLEGTLRRALFQEYWTVLQRIERS
jgi:hypothetical protein